MGTCAARSAGRRALPRAGRLAAARGQKTSYRTRISSLNFLPAPHRGGSRRPRPPRCALAARPQSGAAQTSLERSRRHRGRSDRAGKPRAADDVTAGAAIQVRRGLEGYDRTDHHSFERGTILSRDGHPSELIRALFDRGAMFEPLPD
jgi:hypothetical protein